MKDHMRKDLEDYVVTYLWLRTSTTIQDTFVGVSYAFESKKDSSRGKFCQLQCSIGMNFEL